MSQGFVATFGGLNTIINTGKDEIRPGDFVMADIPDQLKWDDDPFNRYKKAEGIPLDKLLFATVRYDVGSSYKYADDLLTAIAGSTTAVKDALKTQHYQVHCVQYKILMELFLVVVAAIAPLQYSCGSRSGKCRHCPSCHGN